MFRSKEIISDLSLSLWHFCNKIKLIHRLCILLTIAMSKKFVELGTLGILTFDDVQINAAQLTPNGPAFYQEKKLYKDRTIAS